MEKRLSITEQIFGEALDVPRAERSAFLEEACRGRRRCGARWKSCLRRTIG